MNGQRNLQQILHFFRPYRGKQVLAGICLTMMSLLALTTPLIIKIIIDEVLVTRNLTLLTLVCIGLLVIFVSRELLFFLSHYLIHYVVNKVVFDLRMRLFRHLQNISLKYYETRKVGSILSRVSQDVASLQQLAGAGLIGFIIDIFTLMAVFIGIFFLNWRLALVAIIVVPFYTFIFVIFRKKIRHASSLVREHWAQTMGYLKEVFTGIKVVQSFTGELHEKKKFTGDIREFFGLNFNLQMLGVYLWMMADFLAATGLALVLWYGGRMVIMGRMSIGGLVAFYAYVGMLYQPLVRMTSFYGMLQQAMVGVDRVLEVLNTPSEVKESKNAIVLSILKGKVEFHKVSFSYATDRAALTDINLRIQPGEVIALVGPSGSGKSTFVNLLMRFYDSSSGHIYIDGEDLRKLKLKPFRKQVGIVLQESFLFSGSVEDNIRYGRQEAKKEDIIAAAKTANAHNFIVGLPLEYQTQVGENGVSLSGGQRQRISIARAVLRNPRILIFDEATSSLDSEAENLIEQALNRLMQGRTTFIIAHRLSTIMRADRIVVMEKGRIVEIGRHMDLLSKKGLYHRLYKAQFARGFIQESQVSEGAQCTKKVLKPSA